MIWSVQIKASSSNHIELNDYLLFNTCRRYLITWDFANYQYVTCDGESIESSAGIVYCLPAYNGSIQIYSSYNWATGTVAILYVRQNYIGSSSGLSPWYRIDTIQTDPF